MPALPVPHCQASRRCIDGAQRRAFSIRAHEGPVIAGRPGARAAGSNRLAIPGKPPITQPAAAGPVTLYVQVAKITAVFF